MAKRRLKPIADLLHPDQEVRLFQRPTEQIALPQQSSHARAGSNAWLDTLPAMHSRPRLRAITKWSAQHQTTACCVSQTKLRSIFVSGKRLR
jgi:hypothetical protein